MEIGTWIIEAVAIIAIGFILVSGICWLFNECGRGK